MEVLVSVATIVLWIISGLIGTYLTAKYDYIYDNTVLAFLLMIGIASLIIGLSARSNHKLIQKKINNLSSDKKDKNRLN